MKITFSIFLFLASFFSYADSEHINIDTLFDSQLKDKNPNNQVLEKKIVSQNIINKAKEGTNNIETPRSLIGGVVKSMMTCEGCASAQPSKLQGSVIRMSSPSTDLSGKATLICRTSGLVHDSRPTYYIDCNGESGWQCKDPFRDMLENQFGSLSKACKSAINGKWYYDEIKYKPKF